MSSSAGKLITIEDAAARVGVSEKTIRKYIRQGVLGSSMVLNENKRHQIMISEGILLEVLGSGSRKDVQEAKISMETSRNDFKEEALLQATYRVGWLEGQLELHRKMLTEGEEARQQREEALERERREREEALEKERAAVLELNRSLQDERAQRQTVEARAAAFEAEVRQEVRQKEEALERERREKDEALEKERTAVLELDRSLQDERAQRQTVETRAAALEAEVQQEVRQREEALERERREKEDALEKERAAVLELDRSLQEERAQRQAVEARAAALEAKMRELELPWWKKLFRPT